MTWQREQLRSFITRCEVKCQRKIEIVSHESRSSLANKNEKNMILKNFTISISHNRSSSVSGKFVMEKYDGRERKSRSMRGKRDEMTGNDKHFSPRMRRKKEKKNFSFLPTHHHSIVERTQKFDSDEKGRKVHLSHNKRKKYGCEVVILHEINISLMSEREKRNRQWKIYIKLVQGCKQIKKNVYWEKQHSKEFIIETCSEFRNSNKFNVSLGSHTQSVFNVEPARRLIHFHSIRLTPWALKLLRHALHHCWQWKQTRTATKQIVLKSFDFCFCMLFFVLSVSCWMGIFEPDVKPFTWCCITCRIHFTN